MPRVMTISGSGLTCDELYRKCLKKGGGAKRCKPRLARCVRKTGERTRRPPGVRLGNAKPKSLARDAARVSKSARAGRCKAALFQYTVLVKTATEQGMRKHGRTVKAARERILKHCIR